MIKMRIGLLTFLALQLQLTTAADRLEDRPSPLDGPILRILKQRAPDFATETDLSIHIIRQLHPEFQSCSGITEMDSQAIQIQNNHNQHWKQLLQTAIHLMEWGDAHNGSNSLEQTQKAYVSKCFQDYVSLIDANNKHKRLTLFIPINYSDTQDLIDPISFMFNNIQALILKDRSTEIVATRLKGYLQSDRPLCLAVIDELKKQITTYGEGALYPSERQLRDIIKAEKIKDFKKQMAEWLPNHEDLCNLFNQHLDDYCAFIETILLPKSRKDTQLPRDIYELLLNINGIDTDIQTLMTRGKADFDRHYDEFTKLANSIAQERNDSERYPLNNPGKVLSNLMMDTNVSAEETVPLYKNIQKDIEQIIRQEDFITLPQRPLRMRSGTPAEESSFPVPHVNTPSYLNNTGENEHDWPEFVLCDLMNNRSPVGAYALCVHEGRPGHDLQFSRMVEETIQGKLNPFVTILASNSTNAEGWAHYVEYRMSPHFSRENQMGAYQDQLMRMARMFLDPGVNLGLYTHEDIVAFYKEKLGMDHIPATSEANRYTFLMPGQAVAYREGCLQIMDFRAELEQKFGGRFNQRLFHDTLLSYGLMPLNLIKDNIENDMLLQM